MNESGTELHSSAWDRIADLPMRDVVPIERFDELIHGTDSDSHSGDSVFLEIRSLLDGETTQSTQPAVEETLRKVQRRRRTQVLSVVRDPDASPSHNANPDPVLTFTLGVLVLEKRAMSLQELTADLLDVFGVVSRAEILTVLETLTSAGLAVWYPPDLWSALPEADNPHAINQ